VVVAAFKVVASPVTTAEIATAVPAMAVADVAAAVVDFFRDKRMWAQWKKK